MKLVRPYIPIRVRLEVIARQVQLRDVLQAAAHFQNASEQLKYLLWSKFGNRKFHLDHDPSLCLRTIVDAEKGIYDPPANDPEHLIFRTAEEHCFKTFVRGDGAQLSDAGKRRKEKRRIKKLLGLRKIKPSDLAGPYLLPRRLRSANRWPPKGSRPLRGRPF